MGGLPEWYTLATPDSTLNENQEVARHSWGEEQATL